MRNRLISRKSIGHELAHPRSARFNMQGAKKAWNDCKKIPRAGRIAGISRL
jgi:hypothetical protein